VPGSGADTPFLRPSFRVQPGSSCRPADVVAWVFAPTLLPVLSPLPPPLDGSFQLLTHRPTFPGRDDPGRTPQGLWTSGPLTPPLPRSSSASSGRHGRLTPGVSWRRRQQPKQAHEDDRGSREDDPGCCRAADQRGTDHHDQHARKKEPGPPASPQGPRHARSPAARGPSGRGGGQAQRSWHWGHWPVTISPPRPRGHEPSPAGRFTTMDSRAVAMAPPMPRIPLRALAPRRLGWQRPCAGAMQNACRWHGDLLWYRRRLAVWTEFAQRPAYRALHFHGMGVLPTTQTKVDRL
jgi:hypothetical protein